MRIGLGLAAAALATGIAAAVASESMQGDTPRPRPEPPGGATPAGPTATPAPQPPAGRQFVPAPIDALEVRVRESAPPRYSLHVQAGLPNGCAQRGRHDVQRSGEPIIVTVLNSMPTGNPICTMIYGTYELDIDLGTDFRRGVTYTVKVNDRTTTFVGQ